MGDATEAVIKTALAVTTLALAFWACLEIGAGIAHSILEIQSMIEDPE
jgi:hypothetical protein